MSNDATTSKTNQPKQNSPIPSTSKIDSPEKISDEKESDSETQNTSCSEESLEEKKRKTPSPLDNLRLLETTIDSLLVIVEKKA